MNPIVVNCLFLYLTVILLSLLQSRFKIYKDNPVGYIVMLILIPLMIYGKIKGVKTWTGLTGIEIAGYTVMIAMVSARRIIPKLNEGYIYAYTLFHWYLIFELFQLKGVSFWPVFISIISVYPTLLIIKAVTSYALLNRTDKMILYYWFLFTVLFTYADQFALKIVTPVMALTEINFSNYLIILLSAVQLYFISTVCGLICAAIPVFHLDRSSAPFKVRWHNAMREWRKILNSQLDDFIEYQINSIQLTYISVISLVLFYIDYTTEFRNGLIFIYTVLLPLIFFYLKWSPEKNIEDSEEDDQLTIQQ